MWLLSPLVFFFIAIFIHALSRRFFPIFGAVSQFFVIGSLVGLFLIAFLGFYYGYILPNALTALLCYSLLCEVYIFLFSAVLSSISLNLLLRLERGGGTADSISQSFDGESMVVRRIDRMIQADLLQAQGTGAILSPKGKRIFGILTLLRKFFKHPQDNEYSPNP